MTDGNLIGSEQYLTTYLPDTGGMIHHRIKWEMSDNKADNGHWQTFGRVFVEDLPFEIHPKPKEKDMDILIDGQTGEIRWVSWSCEDAAIFVKEQLPADHPTRVELEIGRKVLEVIRDDEEIDDNCGVVHPGFEDQGGPAFLRIWLKQKKPVPLTGLDYLKSLPDGTRFVMSGVKYVVLRGGVYSYGSKSMLSWRDIEAWGWAHKASAETCPEWKPC